MIKRLKNLFTKKLEGVSYWKTVDGHRIYSFDGINHIPLIREMAIRLAYDQMALGIKLADLKTAIKLGIEEANKGNLTNVATILSVLDMQTVEYASERIIMKIGSMGILVDDEKPDKMGSEYTKIKEQLIKNDEVKAFFLNSSLRYLTELSNDLNVSSLKEYLSNPLRAKKEKTFLRLLKLSKTDLS